MRSANPIPRNTPVTTSLEVAARFGKQHLHVLRSIRQIIATAPEGFCQSNFGLTFTETAMPSGGVRQDPMYHITRDGFSLLAMGFTGPEAMQWKVRFIEAFNNMERSLAYYNSTLADHITQQLFEQHPKWALIRELLDEEYPMHYILRQTGYRSPETIRRHARRMAAFGLLERRKGYSDPRPRWRIPRPTRYPGSELVNLTTLN